MKKSVLFILGLCASMSAFAFEDAEVLKGIEVNMQGIKVIVRSGGCTKKSSFDIRTYETSPAQVELVRIKPDFCEAYFPYGKDLLFTYEELGLAPGQEFRLANQVDPGLLRAPTRR